MSPTRTTVPLSIDIEAIDIKIKLGEPPQQLRGRVEAGVEPSSAGGIVSLGDGVIARS